MEYKKNITTIFIVPTLGFPKESLKDNGFINGYIKDENCDIQYEDVIYLLFNPINIDKFRNFLNEEYEKNENIVDEYDYNNFVIIVYKLNKKYQKDYELIKQGKYSKTSKEFQNLFPKAIKIITNGLHKDEISLQIRVFKKTPDLVEYWEKKLGVNFNEEYEVWDGFDFKKETLTKEILEEYV